MTSQRRVTSRDIAKELGISQSTVSRALSNSPRVRPETRAAVKRVALEIGYLPNAMARGLSTKRSNLVGIVMTDSAGPFFLEILQHLDLELARYGHRMLLLNAGKYRKVEDTVPKLAEYRVEGAIFTAVAADSQIGQKCRAAGIPYVLLDRRTLNEDSPLVETDNVAGGRLVAELFVAGGHHNVAFVYGREDSSTTIDRERGFLEALNAHGIRHVLRVGGKYTHDDGYRAGLSLLEPGSAPVTAIFCANDAMALGVLDAARELHVSVPDRLSVIGFDDIALAAWPPYRLTTIKQHRRSMVRAAVEVLLQSMERPDLPPQHRVLPAELVVRQSFRPLAP